MIKIIWEEYYNVANDLSKTKKEAYIRSAVIRCYYSIFGMVRYYLINILGEEKFKSKNNIHMKIINRLKNSKDDNEYYIGSILDNLRLYRNNAY